MFNEFLAMSTRTSRCSASRTTSPTSTASRGSTGSGRSLRRGHPEGDLNDPPGMDTVSALGNRKNELFNHTEGIAPYPGSLRLLNQLEADGKSYAVVSSSRNARPVLEAAGLAPRFAVVVDGVVAAQEHLRQAGSRSVLARRPAARRRQGAGGRDGGRRVRRGGRQGRTVRLGRRRRPRRRRGGAVNTVRTSSSDLGELVEASQ